MRRVHLKSAQSAHFNTIRDINRQIVLNYVREHGPISRAEIARQALLQRSTVSAIVDALVVDGLVEDIGKGDSTGGRCPTLLRLSGGHPAAIGIDISPIYTTVASSDIAGCVLGKKRFRTHPDLEKTLSRAIDAVAELASQAPTSIEGVGVSLPGLVDPLSGQALYIPYFNWRNVDIEGRIASATGYPVTIDNDANAAALAELWFGSPEVSETSDFILVFVSEGLGTGIILDRQIYRGAAGAAGEFGHMIIGQKAPVACSCGSYDCWEAFASGRAATARYAQLTSKTADTQQPTFAQLIERALGGESAAENALLETARNLGIGISNLIVGLSPELIVIGGPIARAWPLLADIFGAILERSVRRGMPSARIIPSTLGERTTLMGALSLVLSAKFASVRTI
ncbi:MAG: ROK family transcriptional regulator [Pyrinomonadaceae bacterium]|nr:ROK family transcriptional regulator [Pyrinomonadaceae bacterium]